jgi:hypothetical protein
MSENNEKLNVENLKKELASFVKQRDGLFNDYLRVDGIVAYVTNQLNTLDADWNKPSPQTQAVEQPKPSKK